VRETQNPAEPEPVAEEPKPVNGTAVNGTASHDDESLSRPARPAPVDEMDIDADGESDVESKLLTPPASTSGASIAVQVEKVEELRVPETTHFIQFQSKDVISFDWNPAQPGSMAMAGTDNLCEIWSMSNHESDEPHSIASISLHQNVDEAANLTVISWSPNGEWLATGTDSGQVAIWSGKGVLYHDLTAIAATMIKLKWSPSGQHLLGVSGDGVSSSLVVWDTIQGDIERHYVLSIDPNDRSEFHGQIYDVQWINDSTFIACGERVLHVYNILNEVRHPVQAFETNDILTFVRFDIHSERIITANSNNEISVWGKIQNSPLQTFRDHTGAITALEWQPYNPADEDARTFVSASADSTVRAWRGKKGNFEAQHVYAFPKSDMPVTAIAYSPDGHLLAAVSDGKMLVWVSEQPGMPRASWVYPKQGRAAAKLWNGSNGVGHEDDALQGEQTLEWSADGRRIGYMLNNEVCVFFCHEQML
jgi:WD40 repeat protein